VVGASGAISAILATLMLFNPWKLSLLLNFFPMPIGVAGFTYMLLNLWSVYSVATHQSTQGMNVAYIGHISGFIAGIFFGMVLCPGWKKNLLISILQFIGFYALVFIIMHFLGLHFVQ
jgi:membrane associated rhomboid family serine protease